MEQFIIRQKAGGAPAERVLAGVVGSGDLEIFYAPEETGFLTVSVTTSVDGQQKTWANLIARLAQQRELPAGNMKISDFGATPGVARLRIEQALQTALGKPGQQTAIPADEDSFIELGARQRAQALLDKDTFRELAGPWDGLASPWLGQQNIVTEADDGMVIAKGTIDGIPVVIAAIEGVFQGGSMGEVSGAKMAAALELAAEDNRNGIRTHAILLLETGGVRLQEANLGLAAIADIHAAIADLRRYTPVIGLISGTVGCFGGMSIAAGLCSRLIVTEEARLGLNGPQVIEQEAGIEEYDSRDRPLIWSMTGGATRYQTGFVDAIVADSVGDIRNEVVTQMRTAPAGECRSDRYCSYLERLMRVDTSRQVTREQLLALFGREEKP